ncbi:MAG: hypothetical protein JWM43_3577 [Acidobacteriaceae bacterium]|nr:hypothetical protein [Acidobacteriaceae bacterium]
MSSVRRFLLLAIMFCMAVAVRAQDAPAAPAAVAPPTTAAPGTQASTGAPTITNPAPAPGQPVAFSHKKHITEAKMACTDCHEPSRNGSTVAMPQPAKCMLCHAAIATDKPDIKRIADAAKNNQVLQWVRVYRLPSFVTFSHKTHTSAGAQCEDCHGPVAQRDAIALEKDISMGGCISCHTQKVAPTGCDTCHQLNSVQMEAPLPRRTLRWSPLLTPTNSVGVGTSLHRFFATLSLPQAASAL